MFERGYMEYHGGRFSDASVLFERSGRLIAILPAHRLEDPVTRQRVFASHEGLSFGGFIVSPSMHQALMEAIFDAFLSYLRSKGFHKLRYRRIPSVYDATMGEEDLWQLHQSGAAIVDCKVGACLRVGQKSEASESFRRTLRRARRAGVTTGQWDDVSAFYTLLTRWLQKRYQSGPVHTIEELRLLWERFPKNMFIHAAWKDGDVVAANLFFVAKHCLRLQYSANTAEGLRLGGDHSLIDALVSGLPEGKWFDFGTSMTPTGDLKNSLHAFKESCGARMMLVKTYELPLAL
jgi:hypothetical protein